MNKLILLIGLVLMGCQVEVKSHDSETIVECKVEVEVMHESGAVNTITPIVTDYNECDINKIQRLFRMPYPPHLQVRNDIIATNVSSYNIIKAEKVY